MSPAPPLPATPVNDSHRILAPRPGFGHSAVGFQYPSRLARSAQAPPLPRHAFAQPFLPHEIRPAQSMLPAERSYIPSTTRLLEPAFATSSMPSVCLVMSQHRNATQSFTRWGSSSAHDYCSDNWQGDELFACARKDSSTSNVLIGFPLRYQVLASVSSRGAIRSENDHSKHLVTWTC